tara:strand:+ start:372 stop:530 length:159 start_codon:yes stop_codon:yes gene_type:complete
MLTLQEAKEKMLLLDETIVLELLDIDSEQILDRFEDVLDVKLDGLAVHLEEL